MRVLEKTLSMSNRFQRAFLLQWTERSLCVHILFFPIHNFSSNLFPFVYNAYIEYNE